MAIETGIHVDYLFDLLNKEEVHKLGAYSNKLVMEGTWRRGCLLDKTEHGVKKVDAAGVYCIAVECEDCIMRCDNFSQIYTEVINE